MQKLLNDDTKKYKKVPQLWYQKGCLIVLLKSFLNWYQKVP